MKMRRSRFALVVSLAVAVTFGAILLPRPSWAIIDHYDMGVRGLACPFCVFGIEKKLKRLPGVRNLRVDLETGRATFDVIGEEALMPQQVRDAVKKAGFTSGDIAVTATGTIEGVDRQLRLRVDQDDALELRGGKGLDQELELAAEGEKALTITGPVEREDKREVLIVEAVKAEGS